MHLNYYVSRIFTLLAVSVLALAASGQGSLTPGQCTLTAQFVIEGDQGKVTGIVTAPTLDNGWDPLPAGTTMRVTVTRSCYTIGETNVAVAEFTDVVAGESRAFVDNATPAWQYSLDYTYTAKAYIGENTTMWGASSSVKTGVNFSVYNCFKASYVPEAKVVRMTATLPAKGADGNPMPVPYTSLEFYKIDANGTSRQLLTTIPSPEAGVTYDCTDANPENNVNNYYMIKANTAFGSAESQRETVFVGLDRPRNPYPVSAEPYDGGIRIFWTAPTEGVNWGTIDPADTRYNVYRCWGREADQRLQIATGIDATEFVDYGTDMTVARLVRYEVESLNSVGVGMSEYSSFDYNMIIGPSATLPFVENFDGGEGANVWIFEKSSYYAGFEFALEAEYGNDITVKPADGTGLAYVDFDVYYGFSNASASMTSYKIDMSDAVCPAVSFDYYAIPDNDVVIELLISTDGTEFTSKVAVPIAKDVAEAGWRTQIVAVPELAGVKAAYIRVNTRFQTQASSAIIDAVRLYDCAPVGDLEIVTDSESMKATVTWTDPSTEYAVVTGYTGFVDGEDVGAVSSPWTIDVPQYGERHSVAVQAVYQGEIVAPKSNQATVFIPRPAITEFTIGDYTYSIVDPTGDIHNVEIKAYTGTAAIINLPERVNYDDISYAVTGVLDGAFKGNTAIVSLSVSPGIATIGAEAFAGCTELMAVSFSADIRTIGSRAFAGCAALEQVIFRGSEVPEVADDAFEGIADGCKGTCPEGTAKLYAAVEGLRNIDFLGEVGIGTLEAAGEVLTEYFDLTGRPVAAPLRNGVTVVRVTLPDGTVRTCKTVK